MVKLLVNKYNSLTEVGWIVNKQAYDAMVNMGLVVRCHNVIDKKGKKEQCYQDKVYESKNKFIKHKPNFTNLKNCLHVFTGKLHGGYIGIDIDVKGESRFTSLTEFYSKLIDSGRLDHTLTCRTPSGGYHFMYKLSEKQMEVLGDQTFNSQLQLFDCDIDVLYNAGRFVMCGAYTTGKGIEKRYEITDWSKPTILPKVIFQEIIKKIASKKESLREPSLRNQTTTRFMRNLHEESKSRIEEANKGEKSKKDATPMTSISDKVSDFDKLLNQYLECLNKERCSKYDSWLKVGAIIYNEQGSFILFNEWSKLCPEKYSLEGCQKVWQSFNKERSKKATIKTLLKWAKEDNPEKYDEIEPPKEVLIEKYINDILKRGISDTKVAKLYSILCSHKYLWDEINSDWYFINKFNIWKKNTTGSKIMYDICKTLQRVLLDKFVQLSNDKSIKGFQKEALIENYGKAIKFLESYQHKKQVLEELKGFCNTEAIYEQLDNVNPYLFAFDNGVYDLKEGKFRLPKPEELISCTCKYEYEEVNDKIKEAMEDIHRIVRSMFSSGEDKDTILTEIGQCLDAVPVLEEFYIWKGKGGNGKGVLRDMISQTFGSYFDPMEIEYLNQTKHQGHANSADPIMATKKNCRIVISTEPDADIKLKFNRIKQITGRDDIQCRHLYGKLFNYKAKFRLFLQTNFDIQLDNTPGQAKTRRTRVRVFPYNFTPKPIMEYDKPIDMTLKERIQKPEYKITFFHILLNYYNKWIEAERKINYSQNFIEQTTMFLAENDPFTPFFEKFVADGVIVMTNDESNYIKMSELFKLFKMFYVGENKSMSNKEFKSALENKGLKVKLLHGCPVIRAIRFNQEKLSAFKNMAPNSNDIEFVDV